MATSNKISSGPTSTPHRAQTICAWASAPGRAGVAVLRISGPQALHTAEALAGALPLPRTAALRTLRCPSSGEVIDEALVLCFIGPRSFTGEDVAELHTHGSPAVMKRLTEILCALPDVRLAEPGEFTRRAFFNGRLDLTEAEGLADLIDAETESQRRQALHLMQGHLGAHYETLRSQLVEAMALLEAYIDFPDEEIPQEAVEEAHRAVIAVRQTAASILDDGGIGEKIRSGLRVAILGAPNVGKSSLLNALARREVAIVSHQAGTTRDVIEVELDVAGYRMILSDTAGLRETQDDIEAEGIRRAHDRAAQADLRIIVFDGSALPHLDPQSLALIEGECLLVINKTDRISNEAAIPSSVGGKAPLMLSLQQGDGLDALLRALSDYAQHSLHTAHPPFITHARHRLALQSAAKHLARFCPDAPLELACEDLRLAAQSIAKIAGKIEVDELLDLVFSRFCIGK